MREDILVTGGSDGSVRVWSLANYQAIHRLAAHDNSVTSLQFDNTRIVSGGSDGRVKVWDVKNGTLVRELSSPADAVWRVVFEEEKAVIMASRGGRTIMEVRNSQLMAKVLSNAYPGLGLFPTCRVRSGLAVRQPSQYARPSGCRIHSPTLRSPSCYLFARPRRFHGRCNYGRRGGGLRTPQVYKKAPQCGHRVQIYDI